MTQLDRTLKRKVSLICTQLVFGCSNEFVLSIVCCLSVFICSFHLSCLCRYECGLSCKLPLESFGIIANSGRVRNRRLYFDGLLRCICCGSILSLVQIFFSFVSNSLSCYYHTLPYPKTKEKKI